MAKDVTFKRPEYKHHEPQIKILNQIYDGIDTARVLITKTPHENKVDYAIRKEKSVLDNYVERIVTTMAGQIFRKPLTYKDIPDKIMNKSFQRIAGNDNINQFAKKLTSSSILDGKAFVLVDMPTDGGDPYFTLVKRTNLVNWKLNARDEFVMAVIHEAYLEDIDDFEIVIREQYRQITEDGTVLIWRQSDDDDNTDTWEIAETITTSYDFVPLYALVTGDTPPLYDIAKMNINHLNSFSKKDQYLDTAGSPIPFGRNLGIDGNNMLEGNEPEEDAPQLVLGVNSVVLATEYESDLKWVEMTGGSISALQDDLEKKEKAMSERALKVINDSTKTATETMSEDSESSSRLTDIAEDAEATINLAYNAWHNMKYSQDAVGTIIVNRDFNIAVMNTQLLAGLNSLQMSGNLSRETLLKTLVEKEVINISSVEDEMKRIDNESTGALPTGTEL